MNGAHGIGGEGLRAAALACAALAALPACAVGPDYHTPEPPTVTRYTPATLPSETASAGTTGGEAQTLVEGRDLPAEWWTVFQSEELDTLVRKALDDSPALARARAKLTLAQENYKARRGTTEIPQFDLGLGVHRVDVQPESLGVDRLPFDTPLTLYDASASVSYTLDLFGRNRRELEGLAAVADYQRFELEGARLMLAGNVVTAAIREAALRQQIEETRGIVDLQANLVGIAEKRAALGGIPQVEVEALRADLATTRASLPDLERRLGETRNRLAVYLGQPPAEAALPEFHLSDLHLPSELPLSLPSDLARQRPDIQAAEALLHEASARVGVATADFYPRITLSATGGSLATVFSSLLSSGTGFSLLAATLAQPIFHGGALKAGKRAALAAYDQAGASYREAVLAGLQDVADVLVALDADARALRDRADAAAAAKKVSEITAMRYEAGGVSYLAVLDAERRHRQSVIEETQAIADRYADSAALFQALGGGWWVEATP